MFIGKNIVGTVVRENYEIMLLTLKLGHLNKNYDITHEIIKNSEIMTVGTLFLSSQNWLI